MSQQDSPTVASPRYRILLLLMLLLVYIFNFVDRQILGILAIPIKLDLGLSDTQLGLLGGLAFALLYSTAAIPLAWLADRTSRTWVITASLAAWSGFTALCGMAAGFWHLFLCRLGVGIGEAGGVAPSFALISDYFPESSRARALAVYSLGIPLGSGLGILLSGWLAATLDWRFAFIAVGLAGLLLAPVFRLIVRDAPRSAQAPPVIPLKTVFAILAGKRSFWLLAFAATSSSIVGYGLAFWMPSVMQRSFGLDLLQTSQFFGVMVLTGGVAGVLLGGVLGDRFGVRDKGANALLPALAFLISAPLFAAGMLAPTATWAFFLFLAPQVLAYVWLAPVISSVQHLVPSHMRATATASFLFINNLLGPTLGTFLLGSISDALTPIYGTEALKMAMLASLAFQLLAAALMALAAKPLRAEWVD